MNTTFSGSIFDAETLAARSVTLTCNDGRLQSLTDGFALDVSMNEILVSDRLGSVPRYLYLPGNLTVETPDNDFIDAVLAGQKRGRAIAAVHWLEARSPVAAAASLLIVMLTAAAIWWGVPALARQGAMAAPSSIEAQAGKTALLTVDRVLSPTQLESQDKQRVEDQVTRLVEAAGLPARPVIEFRSMGGKSPNAFALPGGFIVISDELVKLADDDELAAVLAHEFGHWQGRHGLQTVLRNSTALLVVTTVTGDLSTLTTFAGTIPFVILQNGYSREFETEADAYAVALLNKSKIDIRHFESILKKLEEARPAEGNDFTYLSTHPSTPERIKALQQHAQSAPNAKLTASTQSAGEPVHDSMENPGVTNSQPQPLTQTAPIYPAALKAAGVTGAVTIEFVVDENGGVRTPHVVTSTQHGFDAAALGAVSLWKFMPARKYGRNVPVRISITLQFNLTDPPARAEQPGS